MRALWWGCVVLIAMSLLFVVLSRPVEHVAGPYAVSRRMMFSLSHNTAASNRIQLHATSDMSASADCAPSQLSIHDAAAVLRPNTSSSSVAACAIFRAMHPEDVLVWIGYHQCLGINKFYLYEHVVRTSYAAVLQPLIDNGLVQLQSVDWEWSRERPESPQIWVYQDCINRYRDQHDFIAYVDIDEYVQLNPRWSSLPTFLQRFSDHGGLAMNWQVMGSNGHADRPSWGPPESYFRCIPTDNNINTHIKTIVNTRFVDRPSGDPHAFRFLGNATAVGEDMKLVDGPFRNPATWNDVSVYHYYVKSRQEYMTRIRRGRIDMPAGPDEEQWKTFEQVDASSSGVCMGVRERWLQCPQRKAVHTLYQHLLHSVPSFNVSAYFE